MKPSSRPLAPCPFCDLCAGRLARPVSAIRAAYVALIALLLLAAAPAKAQWRLDNAASQLSFVSTKAEHVAEVHTFSYLTGSLERSGALTITIELASVDTLIPIRDERMRAMLFETDIFPEATVTAQVDMPAIRRMAAGESTTADIAFTLELHGTSSDYTAQVLLLRTADGVIATTLKPIIVNADTFNLLDGVERLRRVAGLPGISRTVPVSFTVSFRG